MKTDFNNLTLRPEVLQILECFVQWIEKRPTNLSIARWFELLSSIHYLKHISRPDPSITPESVRNYLETTNTSLEFCGQDIRAAWGVLNEADLIDRKTLPRPETLYESNEQQETTTEQEQEILPSVMELAEEIIDKCGDKYAGNTAVKWTNTQRRNAIVSVINSTLEKYEKELEKLREQRKQHIRYIDTVIRTLQRQTW